MAYRSCLECARSVDSFFNWVRLAGRFRVLTVILFYILYHMDTGKVFTDFSLGMMS
jgi:hypothetical protein